MRGNGRPHQHRRTQQADQCHCGVERLKDIHTSPPGCSVPSHSVPSCSVGNILWSNFLAVPVECSCSYIGKIFGDLWNLFGLVRVCHASQNHYERTNLLCCFRLIIVLFVFSMHTTIWLVLAGHLQVITLFGPEQMFASGHVLWVSKTLLLLSGKCNVFSSCKLYVVLRPSPYLGMRCGRRRNVFILSAFMGIFSTLTNFLSSPNLVSR